MAVITGSVEAADVEQRMRNLPSHGWTGGWTGRRDRAVLVLSEMAGLSDETIAALTVADIMVADGVATIHTPSGATTLTSNADDLICAPCALARWLHALDMTVLYPSKLVIASVIARCAPLTAHSPHLCQGTMTLTPAAQELLVLPVGDPLDSTPPMPPAGRIPAQPAARRTSGRR